MLIAMDSRFSPNISSFVIRFVVSGSTSSAQEQPVYRGAIRHIQSDEELNFNRWEEAVTFIRRYVPLEVENGNQPKN